MNIVKIVQYEWIWIDILFYVGHKIKYSVINNLISNVKAQMKTVWYILLMVGIIKI